MLFSEVEDYISSINGLKIKYPDMYGNELESIVMTTNFEWLGGNPNDSKTLWKYHWNISIFF